MAFRKIFDGKLKCSLCGELKDPEEFYTNKRLSTGRAAACKVCTLRVRKEKYDEKGGLTPDERQKLTEYNRRYKTANRERVTMLSRKSGIKTKYGVTLEWYEAKLEEQGGVCAICRKAETVLNTKGEVKLLGIDHCHDGGGNRGLLCFRCNAAVGLLQDDPELMRTAAVYIETSRITEAT